MVQQLSNVSEMVVKEHWFESSTKTLEKILSWTPENLKRKT